MRRLHTADNKKRRNICRMAGQIFLLFLRVLRMGHTSKNAKCGHIPIKPRGYPKGAAPPFGTQPLEQRCSVLYLLPRLTGKMRVSHDGHTRFARQESGQVFANGNEQKAGRFQRVAAGIQNSKSAYFAEKAIGSVSTIVW